jgi:hypothetical protein
MQVRSGELLRIGTSVSGGSVEVAANSDRRHRDHETFDYFTEVLLVNQGMTAAKARTEPDWSQSHPGLVEDFRHGSYRN